MVMVFVGTTTSGDAFLGSWLYPTKDLWVRWTEHHPSSTDTINHIPWDRFVRQHVRVDTDDGVHRMDYRSVSEVFKKTLSRYLQYLASLPISNYNKNEQFAYWVNVYNALTVKVILDHYPVESIRDIDLSSGWFSSGPWDKKLLTIEDVEVSLNDIEHRILRPIWKDPRIHYVVNCASVGCPNLQRKALTAQTAEALLEDAARSYINDPRGVEITEDGVVLSSIYYWFAEDFGDTQDALWEHLLAYADPELAQDGSLKQHPSRITIMIGLSMMFMMFMMTTKVVYPQHKDERLSSEL